MIVTAAGETGMPSDSAERVAKRSEMIERALASGIPIERIYVDPLVFPISVDGDFGEHCLAAIRELRARYGPELHITGGMSNVSFGIPQRRLINDVFLVMAIEAGADSGIIDPIANDVGEALARRSLDAAVPARPRRAHRRRPQLPRVHEGVPRRRARGGRSEVTRYRILSWRGIPAQLKVYPESGRPRSVELDEWFAKEIDRVAMREEIMGSDEYLALWEWSKDLDRPGTVDEVTGEVVAEIEAEWRPGRGQAKEGRNELQSAGDRLHVAVARHRAGNPGRGRCGARGGRAGASPRS